MNVPRGAKHHNFKHGRTTLLFKSLPKRFKVAYTASLEDDDLLSLRSDIAISDARMQELVERLDSGESGARWEQVASITHGISEELGGDDPALDKLSDFAGELTQLHIEQKGEERAWRELKSASQHRRKLVDTERQRMRDLQAYLTAEEALAIVGRIADTVIRHVEDKAALSAILHEIQLTTGNDPKERRLELMPG